VRVRLSYWSAVAVLSVGTFLKTNISQNSVATCLRFDVSLCDRSTANFLLSVAAKEF